MQGVCFTDLSLNNNKYSFSAKANERGKNGNSKIGVITTLKRREGDLYSISV